MRTLLEINHDCSHSIEGDPENFLVLLSRALASGSPRSWEPLERYGIRRVVQYHHSAKRKVVVDGQDYSA
jgi:hypothetical protein